MQSTKPNTDLLFAEPLYIVPECIEQATWGGTYICNFKNITGSLITNLAIGQSYELSKTSLAYTGTFHTNYVLTTQNGSSLHGEETNKKHIQSLESFLKKPEYAQFKTPNWALIKFTQAQENSYQAHIDSSLNQSTNSTKKTKYFAKPESWYFFEEGKATIGLSTDTCKDPSKYKKRCAEIDDFAKKLSKKCMAGEISVASAREQLESFINIDHPRNYVQTASIPQNSIIDLSTGGIHHSWEKTDYPNLIGNIVYEVQVDVRDDVSTLRSFDQGKIKDDGSIRALTIDDYFAFLDTDVKHNEISQRIQHADPKQESQTLFNTPYYSLIQYSVLDTLHLDTTQYHHIFVKQGACEITIPAVSNQKWQLPKGWSILLPPQNQTKTHSKTTASRNPDQKIHPTQYFIKNTSTEPTILLATYSPQ